ncbi:PREDICTED: COMM domain-containing protein 1 [Tinamus guttatus]|uniref:COMM domain-containing protein 1 n=1 Tax=Tinamus guttatus TaxID=94827 RepID=UPI00052F405E|nr:PREDICTED: COMM domain-containing protein 1 [Tinamus guttatus]
MNLYPSAARFGPAPPPYANGQPGVTEELLRGQLYPEAAPEEFRALRAKMGGLLQSIASADMDLNQLEAFLTAQTKKQGGITSDQAAVIAKFWKNHRAKIRESLINQSQWDNVLKNMNWRIDLKAQSRHTDQINTPVAIVEMELSKKGQHNLCRSFLPRPSPGLPRRPGGAVSWWSEFGAGEGSVLGTVSITAGTTRSSERVVAPGDHLASKPVIEEVRGESHRGESLDLWIPGKVWKLVATPALSYPPPASDAAGANSHLDERDQALGKLLQDSWEASESEFLCLEFDEAKVNQMLKSLSEIEASVAALTQAS